MCVSCPCQAEAAANAALAAVEAVAANEAGALAMARLSEQPWWKGMQEAERARLLGAIAPHLAVASATPTRWPSGWRRLPPPPADGADEEAASRLTPSLRQLCVRTPHCQAALVACLPAARTVLALAAAAPRAEHVTSRTCPGHARDMSETCHIGAARRARDCTAE